MNLSDADKQKLRDAFSVKASLNGNLMNFIGLDEVRARFPSMWEQHRDRISATAKAILKQYTDPRTDIVLPVGEANFVVLFTRLGKDEAMLRASVIKAEILRRFVGDDALQSLSMEVQGMELDSGTALRSTLGDLLGAASTSAAPPGPDAQRHNSVRTTRVDATAKNRQATQAVFRASMGELGAQSDIPLDTLEKRFGFNLDDLEFAFQPHLYVKRNVFSVFECQAARYSATGEILTGYTVLPREADVSQVAALDQMTLMRARHGLIDMAVRKRVAVVVAPASFETLTNRSSAAEYIALLQKIPSDLRNYLVIDLCRSPIGVPEGRLAEIVNPLKRLSRAVCVHIESAKHPIASIKAAGAFCVGFSIPTGNAVNAEMASPVFLDRFSAMARKLGLQTFVHGVHTQELVQRCREAEVDYMAGRALAELSDYVGPVTELRAA